MFQSTHRRPANTRRNFSNSTRRSPSKSRKQDIHPSKFIKPAKPLTVTMYEATHSFADFGLHALLQNNLVSKGFVKPSHIQDESIPVGMAGKDIIGIANTGTGKTAAFALPILHKIISNKSGRALIIAPTRELATQIEDEFRGFAKGSGLSGAVLIGGSNMGKQLRDLDTKPRIVIGTPGRIKDHIERGSLKLATFDMLVLDEVDRMLDMGFINDIRMILGRLPANRQSFFFSATMTPVIERLIGEFANEPVMITVKTGDTSDNVEQSIVTYAGTSDKIDQLHNILLSEPLKKALIFSETKRAVERLSNDLRARGFKADAMHGNKSQSQRERALRAFKSSHITILVATDVAARGIDVSDITHVINYDTPNAYEDYVHRIGRAGRGNNTGFAITFVKQ